MEGKRGDQLANIVTIHFENNNVSEQVQGSVRRIIGFVTAKSLVKIFNAENNLTPNPRVAKRGPITKSIIETIETDKENFPFMTKGVLIGTSSFEKKNDHAYQLNFEEEYEGIIDGGHNTLALGLYFLSKLEDLPAQELSKASNWHTFSELWQDHKDRVSDLIVSDDPQIIDDLNFVMPVEILVPAQDSEEERRNFKQSLTQISMARNRSVQLKSEALAYRDGLYDYLKEQLEIKGLSDIEWRMNEGGAIKSRELIALSTIVLGRTLPLTDEEGEIKPLAITAPYNSKQSCVDHFNRILESPEVSHEIEEGFRKEIVNERVMSALRLAADIPRIYDYIYAEFPNAMNASKKAFGGWATVKHDDAGFKTKFYGETTKYSYPDGYIYPLLSLLRYLVEDDEEGLLRWKQDPIEFFETHLTNKADQYANYIDMLAKNPQIVGKSLPTYKSVQALFGFSE